MKKIILPLFILSLSAGFAQNVSINATGAAPVASAMLDIASTNSGLLTPRMTAAQRTAIAAPATGLLVYQTDAGTQGSGFYFYNGAIWVPFSTNNGGWGLLGNAGTVGTTNFIGTTDAQHFRVFTNNTERMRFLTTGEVVVGSTTPFAGDVFSSYAAGANDAIATYNTGSGNAIFAQNSSTGNGVTALGAAATAFGGNFSNTNASGTALIASGNGLAGGYAGAGSGGAFTGSRIGVYAVSSNVSTAVSSSGIIGRDGGGTFTMLNGGAGVTGTGGNSAVGMFAYNSGTNNAIYALNNNANNSTIISYNTNASGTGGLFVGNNTGGTTLVSGSGISGCGTLFGVVGISTSAANGVTRSGGYFETNTGQSYAYVGARTNLNVLRKIEGNGTVNTVVKNMQEEDVVLSAPESPENLFQDFGAGKLINGKAHINLDPVFAKNIIVNDKHPLRVFIQLKGDCKGVYVTNESGSGFDVVELQGGNSDVEFQYFVSANRADEILPDGSVSRYSEERFAPAIKAQQKNSIFSEKYKIVTAESKTIDNTQPRVK